MIFPLPSSLGALQGDGVRGRKSHRMDRAQHGGSIEMNEKNYLSIDNQLCVDGKDENWRWRDISYFQLATPSPLEIFFSPLSSVIGTYLAKTFEECRPPRSHQHAPHSSSTSHKPWKMFVPSKRCGGKTPKANSVRMRKNNLGKKHACKPKQVWNHEKQQRK